MKKCLFISILCFQFTGNCQPNFILTKIEQVLFPKNTPEECLFLYGYSEVLDSNNQKAPIIARKYLPNDSILKILLVQLSTYPVTEYIIKYDSLVIKFEKLLEKEFGLELKYYGNIIGATRIGYVYLELLEYAFNIKLNQLKLKPEYIYKFIKYSHLKFACSTLNYQFDNSGKYTFIFENISNLKMFNSDFARKFISAYFHFEHFYFKNESILRPYLIQDLETVNFISENEKCDLFKSDTSLFNPFFYQLFEYYIKIPNAKITDIFITNYFKLCDKNIGVARYLGLYGDQRCFPILDSVFEGKYNCLWKDCIKETFQAFTFNAQGQKLGIEFLKMQLEKPSIDINSKINYIDYFSFINPIDGVNYLSNFNKTNKSKILSNKIELKLIEMKKYQFNLNKKLQF